jgi:hypothetical protein
MKYVYTVFKKINPMKLALELIIFDDTINIYLNCDNP